jgi:hypothetical protein
VNYRIKVIAGLDRGWEAIGLDSMGPGERERLLLSREHLVEVRRGGEWYPFSTWAMPPAELAAQREVSRLESQAEGVRAQAERPIQAAEARLTAAKAGLEEAKSTLELAESALKDAKVAQRKAGDEAGGIDRLRREAEKELVRVQSRQAVAVA